MSWVFLAAGALGGLGIALGPTKAGIKALQGSFVLLVLGVFGVMAGATP